MVIRNLYAKCKMHGSGDAQVVLSDQELYSLILLSIVDLGWEINDFEIVNIELPGQEYYGIPLIWFSELSEQEISSSEVIRLLTSCKDKEEDFMIYIENLSSVHRRRVKFRRILATQPMPTMDQIGPRVLLEFGTCNSTLLANWMTWRKWIYDIDNRAAQETGYVFEPILASCLGGESIGARNSPVKRLNESGQQTNNGRQVDCFLPDANTAYEFKLRVTIAASGQGRFGEELSFPAECEAAGITPVLLVLDPTPSPRLDELSRKFLQCQGGVFIGDDAWTHMKERAGDVISVFIDKYIRPAIEQVEAIEMTTLQTVSLSWSTKEIIIRSDREDYKISRE